MVLRMWQQMVLGKEEGCVQRLKLLLASPEVSIPIQRLS